jgi:hypothetical protein
MMETFGVNYCSESSVTGHCAARDHASSQLPVKRRSLTRAQSVLHESIITHTCHTWLKVSSNVIEINIQQSYNDTHTKAINCFSPEKEQYQLILLPLYNIWNTNKVQWEICWLKFQHVSVCCRHEGLNEYRRKRRSDYIIWNNIPVNWKLEEDWDITCKILYTHR